MALKQYIGARYTPKFEGPWNASKEYSALSVVYANNKSYVARKTVPAGTEVSDTDYWVQSADWNAQVEQYNQNVTEYKEQVDTLNKNVQTYTKQVNQFYADTLHSYETRDEMIADTNIKVGDTLLTCGKDAIGDGGGSFYQVVNKQSAKTIVLANGLYAEPFEFQPYDYAAFEKKVDEYKAEVDEQLGEVEKYSLRNYDTTSKMVADKSLTSGNTVLTSGETSVGDGQGSFWKVVDQQGSDTTALANGKYAKPFQLNPYEVSNRVVDNLNPDFKTGVPPCMWSGTIHGNGVNLRLGTLPAHLQDDGSYAIDCTIFLNASFETTTERTSAFSVIHGGYAGLPALTYKFNITGKNESENNTKTELIAVRLMAKYTDEAYSMAKGSNTVVTSWSSAETDIDYNAPEAITQVVTAADSTGEAVKWTGLPRSNSFFMPITAKKDGFTLSALHFTAGANVSDVNDSLWTITFSKYDDTSTLFTANFYAVNGSEVEYNVNVGFTLAKGVTYKMTFSGSESAKMNFPSVSAGLIQESEDVDIKTAPGYWNDNSTVVFAGSVDLTSQASPGSKEIVFYNTTKQITTWTGASSSNATVGAFFVNTPLLLTNVTASTTFNGQPDLGLNARLKTDPNNFSALFLVKYHANYSGNLIYNKLLPALLTPAREYGALCPAIFGAPAWKQATDYGSLQNNDITTNGLASNSIPFVGKFTYKLIASKYYSSNQFSPYNATATGAKTLIINITAKRDIVIKAIQLPTTVEVTSITFSFPTIGSLTTTEYSIPGTAVKVLNPESDIYSYETRSVLDLREIELKSNTTLNITYKCNDSNINIYVPDNKVINGSNDDVTVTSNGYAAIDIAYD